MIRETLNDKIIIKVKLEKTSPIVNGLRNIKIHTKERKNYYLESYQNYIQPKIINKITYELVNIVVQKTKTNKTLQPEENMKNITFRTSKKETKARSVT